MATENPTKTLSIELAWHREINRRWVEFRGVVVKELRRLNEQALLTNAFVMDVSQQRVFLAFLRTQIDIILMGSPEPPNWQAQYQLRSYERGIARTTAALRSQGADLIPTPEEIQAAIQLPTFTAQPSLVTGVVTSKAPIHQDALEFLFNRSYASLEGWTDKLEVETRQILFDGVSQGKGIREVTREMVDRIGVSKSRAQLIARTETIQAFQHSTINETQRAAEELGEVVLLRWITSRDTRVRHLHARWHGTLKTSEQTQERIGVSPWNCRCAQIPVIAEANTPAKNKKFAEQRRKLLLLEGVN